MIGKGRRRNNCRVGSGRRRQSLQPSRGTREPRVPGATSAGRVVRRATRASTSPAGEARRRARSRSRRSAQVHLVPPVQHDRDPRVGMGEDAGKRRRGTGAAQQTQTTSPPRLVGTVSPGPSARALIRPQSTQMSPTANERRSDNRSQAANLASGVRPVDAGSAALRSPPQPPSAFAVPPKRRAPTTLLCHARSCTRSTSSSPDGGPRGEFSQLRRRISLTYQYHGPGVDNGPRDHVSAPVHAAQALVASAAAPGLRSEARSLVRSHGRPVTIVIPSYRDATHGASVGVAAIRRTTERGMVSIVVSDDAAGPEHIAALNAIEGIRNGEGARTAGSPPTSTGDTRCGAGHGIVILNSDTIARRGWLANLQYAAIRRGRRHRRRQAALYRWPDPVRWDRPQPRRSRVVRPPISVPASGLRPQQRAPVGALC